MQSVLVEIKADQLSSDSLQLIEKHLQTQASSFTIDMDYPVVPMQNDNNELHSYLVRGKIEEMHLQQLKTSSDVLDVLPDSNIAPFA